MATRSITRSCTSASSSASRAFLQVTARRNIYTNPPLDFLLPNASVYTRALPASSIKSSSIHGSTQMKRGFATSQRQHQTTAIVNPRQDEDGNLMQVEITPRASNRLRDIMKKDSNPDLALRIKVESGGCHGYQYLMSLTTLPPNLQSSSEDTIFATDDGSGAKIVMDEPSLELLKGSKVDYTMELIGSQFKIVDNPLASSNCGCGTSFDIKF